MRLASLVLCASALAACNAGDAQGSRDRATSPSGARPFVVQELAAFNEPWAMTFLPGGEALITEKGGRLVLWSPGISVRAVAGVPRVAYAGQGGLGDVVLHPEYGDNKLVYLSWVEAGSGGTSGAVVGRARLETSPQGARLGAMQVIWRQSPKVSGSGHFGHRMAFSPNGQFLFITSSDRQKFTPAQDMGANLGKVVRLSQAGGIPSDNPFHGRGAVTSQIWSLGHRNPLGIAFAPNGDLWTHEMGPRGGDEMNRIERGANYGYPIVSNGNHYDGRNIPDHSTRPEYNAPELSWTPVISPAGLIFYSGNQFRDWRGDAFMGGLSGQALLRIEVDGGRARVADRWDMGARIREVEQGPDGAIYLLEDGARGRLLKLTPAR